MAHQSDSPWIVVHMAHGQRRADVIRQLLEGEGFMVKLRQIDGTAAEWDGSYEVLVLKSESREARALMVENGLA